MAQHNPFMEDPGGDEDSSDHAASLFGNDCENAAPLDDLEDEQPKSFIALDSDGASFLMGPEQKKKVKLPAGDWKVEWDESGNEVFGLSDGSGKMRLVSSALSNPRAVPVDEHELGTWLFVCFCTRLV